MNNHPQFTLETFLKIASDLILRHKERHLKDSEIAILEGVWKWQKYEQIEEDKNYYKNYLTDVGSKLWRVLSEALGEKVNKANARFTIEQKWQRDSQSNLTCCQTQIKDCLVHSLLVTRNTYAKSVGNIDDSCNLVKDSANKLRQKPGRFGIDNLSLQHCQVACQPKFDRDTNLTDETVVQVIESFIYLCMEKHLTYLEKRVISGIWNGENYDDIANKIKRSRCKNRKLCNSNCECKYSPIYIRKNIASDLWSKLSKAFVFLDYEINKDNFKPTLERWYEKMKPSFIYSYLQLNRTDLLFTA